MTAKKYLPIALFIGLQTAVLQALDQTICSSLVPLIAGGSWVSFQAWAMYFLGGCTPKGGLKAFVGYVLGMILAMIVIMGGGALNGFGFWAMPVIMIILVPFVMYLELAPELLSFVPAVFIGAGTFFGIMSYIPGATFASVFMSEGLYCIIGLVTGFITISFRGWYEGKYIKA